MGIKRKESSVYDATGPGLIKPQGSSNATSFKKTTTLVQNGVRVRKDSNKRNSSINKNNNNDDDPDALDPTSFSDDIAAFIGSQDVSSAADVADLLSESVSTSVLQPKTKKQQRKLAKVEKKLAKAGGGYAKKGDAGADDEEDERDENGNDLVVKGKKIGGSARMDVDDANNDDDDGLLDMEEEAELKAYLEIKKEERRRQKKLKTQGAEEDDEDDDEDDLEDDEDNTDGNHPSRKSKTFVNDKASVLAKLAQIKLSNPTDGSKFLWIEYQDVTAPQDLDDADVDDDLKREVAFYNQALESAKEGIRRLKAQKVSVERPPDFFAEMVKSDEHMLRIRQKLVEENQRIENAEKAKEMRLAKKFGKKVQQQKLADREKSKREELEKVKLLRKKASSRANDPDAADGDGDDEFGISVDNSKGGDKSGKKAGGAGAGGAKSAKRKSKDAKFGFGGGKRHAKENTRDSTNDMSGFSVRKMKQAAGAGGKKGGKVKSYGGKATKVGPGGAGKKSRPGKARRQHKK